MNQIIIYGITFENLILPVTFIVVSDELLNYSGIN